MWAKLFHPKINQESIKEHSGGASWSLYVDGNRKRDFGFFGHGLHHWKGIAEKSALMQAADKVGHASFYHTRIALGYTAKKYTRVRVFLAAVPCSCACVFGRCAMLGCVFFLVAVPCSGACFGRCAMLGCVFWPLCHARVRVFLAAVPCSGACVFGRCAMLVCAVRVRNKLFGSPATGTRLYEKIHQQAYIFFFFTGQNRLINSPFVSHIH